MLKRVELVAGSNAQDGAARVGAKIYCRVTEYEATDAGSRDFFVFVANVVVCGILTVL